MFVTAPHGSQASNAYRTRLIRCPIPAAHGWQEWVNSSHRCLILNWWAQTDQLKTH
jgi:hypothetical protein